VIALFWTLSLGTTSIALASDSVEGRPVAAKHKRYCYGPALGFNAACRSMDSYIFAGPARWTFKTTLASMEDLTGLPCN
jgi:hypothetical protein